jgi:VanZ family protein
MSNRYLRMIPLILWCALIFYMSSQDAVSVAESRSLDIFIHKLAHLFEYAVLYLLFMFAIDPSLRRNQRYAIYGVIFTALYGLSDEVHQSFNPTRSPQAYDVLVDALGGLIGFAILRLAFAKFKIQK